MFKRLICILFMLLPALAHGAGTLLMIAPRNQAMPIAQFDNDKLVGGIIKDLSEAIAQRLGRSASFLSVAGDQVGATLRQGKADGVCYVRPFWIDGDFNWSQPLIPDAELVAAAPDAPLIRSLYDLRDRPVGTVRSYRYPRVEQVLGLRFQRHDALTMEDNLHSIMQGTYQYTVIGQATLGWQMKVNKALKLRSDLVIASFTAQCAFAKKSSPMFSDIDKAINGLVADGSVDAILARYR